TAPTSPGRSTARRESSTPSSTLPGWTRSASASMRPVTTTGRTCSAYASRPTRLGNSGKQADRQRLFAVRSHAVSARALAHAHDLGELRSRVVEDDAVVGRHARRETLGAE